jgi:uncharacterized cupredoxin-like copper-binding protein
MSYTNVSNLNSLPAEILRGLVFYKEEIKILQDRLELVSLRNNSFEARQGIEHFQNQFIMHQNNIDELKHSVNLMVEKMSKDAQQHGGRIEKESVDEEEKYNDEYVVLEKVIKDMRKEFNLFLSKWM